MLRLQKNIKFGLAIIFIQQQVIHMVLDGLGNGMLMNVMYREVVLHKK